MTINILGANWAIIERSEADDDRLHDCDGYCDWTTHEVVVRVRRGLKKGGKSNVYES